MSSLPKAVTWKQTGRDSNPRPFGLRANALPVMPHRLLCSPVVDEKKQATG